MRTLMLVALGVALAGPAAAQQVAPTVALPGAAKPKPVTGTSEVSRNAPVNGVLVLYGNERCPTNSDGAEVVVCTRRSASEKFRVPKELREFQVTPQNESWAARAPEALSAGVGVNSIGSCSVVGQAGQTGCFNQAVRGNRRENQARKADQANADRIIDQR